VVVTSNICVNRKAILLEANIQYYATVENVTTEESCGRGQPKDFWLLPQYNGVSVSCSRKVLFHRIRYKAKYLKCLERLAEMKFYWASFRFNTELNFDVSALIWVQTKGEEYCVTVEARIGLRPSFPLLCLWPNTPLLFEWQQRSLLACIIHQISVLVTNFYYPEI
jgi:hypothetical protein